jgi:hypothetical protein
MDPSRTQLREVPGTGTTKSTINSAEKSHVDSSQNTVRVRLPRVNLSKAGASSDGRSQPVQKIEQSAGFGFHDRFHHQLACTIENRNRFFVNVQADILDIGAPRPSAA